MFVALLLVVCNLGVFLGFKTWLLVNLGFFLVGLWWVNSWHCLQKEIGAILDISVFVVFSTGLLVGNIIWYANSDKIILLRTIFEWLITPVQSMW